MFEGVSTTLIILILIALLLLVILITLGAVVYFSGLFFVPEVGAGKPPVGKCVIAYKFAQGPYNESGPLYTETCIIAPRKHSIGIFYDDPRKVESFKLRYIVGSILSQDSEPIDEELVKTFQAKDFKIMSIPKVDHVVKTTFPYTTPLSIMMGAYKVYPRMNEYIEQRSLCAYPYLEFYDDEKINYFAPLSKQDLFFAPECDHKLLEEDYNETFDSTMSSTDDTLNDSTNILDDTPERDESLAKDMHPSPLSSLPLGSVKGEGDEVLRKTGADQEETPDNDDNSSSSSFEVVKTEETDNEK